MPTAFQLHSSYLLSRITHIIDYNDEVGYNFNIKGTLNSLPILDVFKVLQNNACNMLISCFTVKKYALYCVFIDGLIFIILFFYELKTNFNFLTLL